MDYRAEQERARPQKNPEIPDRDRSQAAEQEQARNRWLRSTILNYIGKPIPDGDLAYFPPAPRAAEQEQARKQEGMQNYIATPEVRPSFRMGITGVFEYKLMMSSPLGIVGERRTPPSASTAPPLDPPPCPPQTTRRILFTEDTNGKR